MPIRCSTLLLLLVLALAGCTATTREVGGRKFVGRPTHITQSMVSCAEATRAARVTVQRLGYTVTDLVAAEPNKPGRVVGEREVVGGFGESYGAKQTLLVEIECSDAGSDLTVTSSAEGLAAIGFGRQFQSSFETEVGQRRQRAPIENEKPRGLQVSVEPLRSDEAIDKFGVDLPANGVIPVSVTIDNGSDRRYSFSTESFVLFTVQDKRETPLAVADAARRVPAAKGEVPLQKRLADVELAPGELGPGQKASGYLFFNASTYRRGRATITDVESEEAEGFSLNF